MLLPRWDGNISVFANKMKPFCTLGHGQASFSDSAMPVKDTSCLVCSALPIPRRSVCNITARGNFWEHPCLSLRQIWHCLWLLQTHENLILDWYPLELPQLAFTSCQPGCLSGVGALGGCSHISFSPPLSLYLCFSFWNSKRFGNFKKCLFLWVLFF